jgi:hypothetical protein
MTKYADIIKRLEMAEGPNREIDYLIHDWELQRSGLQVRLADIMRHWTEEQRFSILAGYTSSIDAAIALVERMLPGSAMMLDTRFKPACKILPAGQVSSPDPKVEAATLPLAILLALFRALEAKEATNEA